MFCCWSKVHNGQFKKNGLIVVIFLCYLLAFVIKKVCSGVYFTFATYCGNILYGKKISPKITSGLSELQHLFGTLNSFNFKVLVKFYFLKYIIQSCHIRNFEILALFWITQNMITQQLMFCSLALKKRCPMSGVQQIFEWVCIINQTKFYL